MIPRAYKSHDPRADKIHGSSGMFQWGDSPDLHAARPVAHVLAQQQVVHGTRADEVENLGRMFKTMLV